MKNKKKDQKNWLKNKNMILEKQFNNKKKEKQSKKLLKKIKFRIYRKLIHRLT